MKLVILAVGRLKEPAERTLVEDYLRRAKPLLRRMGISDIAVRELPESRANTAELRKRQEADEILKRMDAKASVLLLDERGEHMTSREFTGALRKLAGRAGKELAIIIGGPDGVDERLRDRADVMVAFGRMTWPHRLVRVMLAEQLYRAGSIAAGLPYHRD